MLSKTSCKLLWLMIAGIVISVDQTTKFIAMMSLSLNEPITMTGFLNFTYTQNKGIAFSLFDHSHPVMHALVTVACVLVTAFLVRWFWQLPLALRRAHLALALIIGGAIGNLIDRFILGHVRDFFHFYWGQWHFAIFNVADVMISVGALLLILDILLAPAQAANAEGKSNHD